MIQLIVEGVFLDLYQDDPIRLTLSIEDIEDGNIRSDYSKTFRVPATSNNNDFFHQAYEINGIDFDFTIKREASIYVDGILFRKGELRLVKIYNTRDGANIDYECVFYGSTRNFATSVGPGSLCELNLSGYNHNIAYTAITKSWEAYPSGTTTSGLFNGDILYPLVNFGNTYSGTTPSQTLMHRGNGVHFTNSSHPLFKERFRPMVRAKVIWDQIFSEAGFTYSSDFLNSNLFKKLYVSAWGNQPIVETPGTLNNAYVNPLTDYVWDPALGTTERIPLRDDSNIDTYDLGNNWNNVNYEYVIPSTGSYTFSYGLLGEWGPSFGLTRDIRLRLVRSGATLTNLSNIQLPTGLFVAYEDVYTGSFTAGDKVYLTLTQSGDTSIQVESSSYIDVIAPGQISLSRLFDCNYKKIDFIKDIITKFRLVLSPDKIQKNKFNISPWQEYIGTGDIYDWTEKLAVEKDFVSEPLFLNLTDRIIFKDQEEGDWINKLNQDTFKEVFGTQILDSSNDLLNGEKIISTNFAPTPVTQIWNGDTANNGMANMIIPQIMVVEPEESAVLFKPIKPKTRLLFYNGMKSVGISVANEDDYYIQNDSFSPISWRSYPMVSPYSDFPISGTTLDLNWERENGYIQFGLEGSGKGSAVYNSYWSVYINSLYNKWARKVTAYFKLNSTDLQDFTFDDVIFVKNAYYYVTKISDVPIGQSEIVQVEMIKLIGYVPPTTNFDPPELNLWNLDGDIWNSATQLWDE